MHSVLRRTLPLLLALLLCHCGAPQPPQCRIVPRGSRAPAVSLLASARHDWAILKNPARRNEWAAARVRYNDAAAKLFDQLRCGPDGWDTRAAALGTRIAPPGPRQTDVSGIDALFPASSVKVKKSLDHKTTGGIGVPLVGWKKTTPVGTPRPPYLLPNGLPYMLTATLEFDGNSTPAWRFSNRWLQNDTMVGATTHTLAADWTAPNAFYWEMCDLDDLKLQNVILPDRFSEETGLYFLQAYDPEKIPLVFVHGLVSSPDAFKSMINDLAPNPWFREHYQIWLFNYPTGNPWIYSSMNFRKSMNAACAYARSKGDSSKLNRMVIVSHSMGGLLTRSSVTDPKTAFYDANFDKPLDKLPVGSNTRAFIRDSTLYQPLTEPDCVVFCAVPHRGSPMANFRFANWISRLIRLPKTLTVELLDATLQSVGDIAQGEDPSKNFPTAINSLSPNNRATKVIGNLPLPRHITFHSIIGDRGKGDTPDSSDGVVPYWSSHVEPVKSELIVPSNHSVPDNPQAATELEHILKKHLGSSSLKTEN